jgi:peptide/nickel transport system substrate-binding protein
LLVVAAIGLAVLSAASAGGLAARPSLTIASSLGCGDLSPVDGSFVDVQLSYEPLIRVTPDGSFAAGLALSWRVKSGNKTITMTLRRNARFSDGTAVTAEAVKQWFDYKVKTEVAGDAMGPVRSVTTLGRWGVRLTLKTPNPLLVGLLSFPSVSNWGVVPSPRAVARLVADPKSTFLSGRTDGAGPYVAVPSQTVTADHCTLVPNQLFYDKSQLKWGKIVMRRITDSNSALAAMKTGQVDVWLVADATTAPSAAAAGITVLHHYGGYWGLVFLDHGKLTPALADVRVRQALNYAIDRKTIARAFFGSLGVPTSMPNPGSDGDNPRFANYYPYNPAKAKALLAAAGYPDGFSFKDMCFGPWLGAALDGTSFNDAVAKYLAAIGVTMQVNATATASDFSTALANHDNSTWGLYYGFDSTEDFYKETLQQGAGVGDQHGWHDPVLDRLWLRAQRVSPQAAAAIWREMTAREVQEAYFVPVMRVVQYTFVGKRVGGVKVGAFTYGPNNITQWYPTGE